MRPALKEPAQMRVDLRGTVLSFAHARPDNDNRVPPKMLSLEIEEWAMRRREAGR